MTRIKTAFTLTTLGLALASPLEISLAQSAAPKVSRTVVRLVVEPAEIPMYGPRSEGRFVATAVYQDGSAQDVTDLVAVKLDSTKVATLTAERLFKPTADGAATIAFSFGGRTATAKVVVKQSGANLPVEFTREVVPALTRNGCNQGTCHGAQYGKGGFRLSLLGFESDVDHFTIMRQASGRRANVVVPEKSLLLQKPSMQIAHQGGLKLKAGSPDYQLILQWLRDGAPAPTAKDPEVTKVEVYPNERVQTPGGKHRLIVYATYSDGVVRDVTRWARLNSLNDAIASVSPSGTVAGVGPGQASIMVRFCGIATVSRVAVPFSTIGKYPTLPLFNYVDNHVQANWKRLGLLPSGLADDATFLRRASLDIIGTIPTAAEVRAFLADSAPDKRTKLIDRLLDRPEYADYWTLKWGDLLRSTRTGLGPKGMWSLTNWIRSQFRENRPMDGMVRDLITAQGSTFTNGPANYYRVASNPQDLAETTSQVFLGLRLQCAKCHHHPFERWSQKDYYQFAAFFSRVGLKGSQEFGLFGNEQVVRVNKYGNVHHPKTGALMTPTPIGGYPEWMMAKDAKTAELKAPDADASGDRRSMLADWIGRDNPLFARNIVNRYWGYLMGRGLVEPIDDMRISNPPTNPELLDALARDFAENKYDVKRLIRTICTSRVYQLDSRPTKQNENDTAFYTHYYLKRVPAEPLLDAVNHATGTLEKFPELPLGTRAIQLPDPGVASQFLDTFGRAPRVIACECERTPEPTVTQALHLMMGDLMNRKLQDGNGLLGKLLKENKKDEEIIEMLYLTTIGRVPRSEEMRGAVATIEEFSR